MVHAMQNAAVKETDPYLEKFGRFEREAKQPSWVFPLRKAGLARFAELGFPTIKDEDWRFTNVAPIAKLPFNPVFQIALDGLTAEGMAQFPFGQLKGRRLVFVNGHYAAELSSPGELPSGVRIGSLAAALADKSGDELLAGHLGRYAQEERNAFAALNTAFFQDGAFIHVAAGKSVDEPVRLLFISTAKE